ncbi:MAG: 16S rRNA (cytosine(1402)-N(4))-methyltransferase RsmH [Gammaproteobacteria bacterium]|nr:16S rRNA (cytosine(1402)-N(4))-methyltransferase RsmH [Gammaproteobacteria bacterium]MBU1725246.1 16S rRNA (cytosine(1402)-N(4))-methyltransferase RsmH [Gammaproteobacteria bacterium]MBU2005824.1 16S rRNA (cytosine(1402)-N(4))-methyltransferase RsmH [Gammaproteobacteria bacterium]
MTEPVWKHDTVLLNEAVAALNVQASGIYVDGTYGRGGHSALILEHLGERGRLIVTDKDPVAIEHARERHAGDPRVFVWHGSFRDFPEALAAAGIVEGIQGILLDLGVSSPQLDDAERGFSFMREGRLDMRMDTSKGESAAEWLGRAMEADIADVLWRYGEERFSRQIAREIVRSRSQAPLQTTTQLAELIASVVRKREPGKHPATRSFQAIRIKVNQELDDVEECLRKSVDYLALGGRLVVISFHSLEDRIVKHFLREVSTPPRVPKGLPVMPQTMQPPMRIIGKAIRPADGEVQVNVRARSAIMRIGERAT